MSSESARLETTFSRSDITRSVSSWIRPENRGDSATGSQKHAVSEEFKWAVANILDQAEELMLSKQEDYGPGNINSPFGPLLAILVRLHDKQARAANLIKKGGVRNHESLEDTFLDMLNYSLIALMVIRGEWPGIKAGDW